VAEDSLLFEAVRIFGVNEWHQVARLVPGRSARQCRERWNNYLNPNLYRGEWTPVDDDLLMQRYAEHGPRWVRLARFFPGRSKNSVRNRFLQLSKREPPAAPQDG
jgi:hypothetical protein